MNQILKAAGIDLDHQIDVIIASCKECRAWARPKQEVQQSLTLATRFNQIVETDLMFYRQWTVHHFICRGSRWLEACESPDKLTKTLMNNTATVWVSRHGPPEILVCDGESGYCSDEGQKWLKS